MYRKFQWIMLNAVLIAIVSSLNICAVASEDGDGRMAKWKERMEAIKQEIFKELNLSDEQKQKLEENRKKHMDGFGDVRKKIKDLRADMRQELEKEVLDMVKINQIQSQLKETQAQMMDNRLQSILEVRSILTPEQFKVFSAKMEEHKERSFKQRWDKDEGGKMMPEDGPDGNPHSDHSVETVK